MGICYRFVTVAATILCFLQTVLGCSCFFPPHYSTPLESVCIDYQWSSRVFAGRVINASCNCIPSVPTRVACLSGNVSENQFTSRVVAEATCDGGGIFPFFGPRSCKTILDKFKPIGRLRYILYIYVAALYTSPCIQIALMKDKCLWTVLHCVLQRAQTWAWLLLVQEFV